MKKFFILILIICGLIAIGILAVKKKRDKLAHAKVPGNRPIPVTVGTVRKRDFLSIHKYVGIMRPINTVNISSRIISEIIKIYRREGDRVKKGEMLIKLDDRNFKQAVVVAKARIENVKTQIAANEVSINSLKNSVEYWKRQVERDKKLKSRNIVPEKQLETSREKLNEANGKYKVALQKKKTLEALLAAAEGDLRLAETNLSYTDIRAPFDCVICEVPVDPGDLASPGKKLMLVENQKQLKLTIEVPQADIKNVKIDDTIYISFQNIKTSVIITKIYPSVGADKMVRIEAVLNEKVSQNFISGQYVNAYLVTTHLKDVLIIPSDALNSDNNSDTMPVVFVVEKGKLIQTSVKVIANNEKEAAVAGKLKPGDKLVTSAFLGWAKLADGLKAKIVKTITN